MNFQPRVHCRTRLMSSAAAIAIGAFVVPAHAATEFEIPAQPLPRALAQFGAESGFDIIADSKLTATKRSSDVKGDKDPDTALADLLRGTGLTYRRSDDAFMILAADTGKKAAAAAAMPAPSIETVVVTAQKKTENIQTVPIAVTALSQQQLTERQIAGGPDLLREVPNMDFTKTNFSGYNIELRGIGTQAISVTTDPAVAVAFNDTSFIRNHFFEQEFYDLSDVEVLRGPQGTLYGRNATAGVVNLTSALPTDTYEAMLSADLGNYENRRLEGMLNLPIVGDKLDLRIAGEWTKRDGYTEDTTLNVPVDGRDLWSGRMTLGWKPASNVQTYLIWEHFSEDDDRLRSGKQLCETAVAPTEVDGVPVPSISGPVPYDPSHYLDQGCQPTSLYARSAFEVPDGNTLPYYTPFCPLHVPLQGCLNETFDPYAETTQSTNLRQIESAILPHYRAKNDTLEYNANWSISPDLTFTSQTGYNNDFLFSTEDYNRFDTAPGAFVYSGVGSNGNENGTIIPDPLAGTNGIPANSGIFCDPQIGCSDRLVAEDLSEERAWQFSQEFRLASNFSGPLNFSAGGNYLHYETLEDYYVFINTLTLEQASYDAGNGPSTPWIPGVSNNASCLQHVGYPQGYQYVDPNVPHPATDNCGYIDPNPIGSLNGEGHNYFLSQNPYVLNSYALFGELYYNIAPDLKFTAGARVTEDQKHFIDIPSELLVYGYGYPVTRVVDQRWDAPTGRAVLDWAPNLDFTDQTLVYGSYAHGYKAGGANPPGADLLNYVPGDITTPDHPLTFKPEFIDAFELGTKNTFLGDSLTVNGDIFYYNYTGYQISEIVDRTAINNNYNAQVKGAELETNWEPVPGLKFGLTGGFEDATADRGDTAIDLMNRTNSVPGWMVIKPFPTQASNCILPTYVVAALMLAQQNTTDPYSEALFNACAEAYSNHVDPITILPYTQNPSQTQFGAGYIPPGYPGFDPLSVDPNAPKNVNNGLGLPPNNGEGFSKNISGNQLPNAPHFTTSFTAEYSMPVSDDWVATLHGDFYWQSQSWARILNDDPYDKLRGYSNVNLSLILNSANGWQVMGYVKNVFNVTAITGDFLNSDDSGLTTNVFLTDPRLYGVRVTKQLDQGDGFWGSDYNGYDFFNWLFSDADNGKPPLWIEIGGDFDQLIGGHQPFDPPFLSALPANYGSQIAPQKAPGTGLDTQAVVSFEPEGSDWVLSAAVRYGRTHSSWHEHKQTNYPYPGLTGYPSVDPARYVDAHISDSETHAILDFMAGKDIGLGMFGLPGTSVLSGGARYVAFTSRSGVSIFARPDVEPRPTDPKYHHTYSGSFDAKRSFHGIGPAISWNASTPFMGDEQNGELTFDWGANGAVLFGRQKVSGAHSTGKVYYCFRNYVQNIGCPAGFGYDHRREPVYQRTNSFNRSRMATVPDLGGFIGMSMRYNNAKVSFGYRADEFFGAMDGGIDSYKAYNRGFFGPFASVSIGLGG